MNTGISNIAMYTPNYYLSMLDFAKVKNLDYNKFLAMGQNQMSICPPDEDIVTMASNAASRVIKDIDTSSIGLVLFATESSIDQAKSAGLFLHKLLELPSSCRIIELKQSCYAATGGLQLALSYIRAHPQQKVLLIAADIARYDLDTPAESSQGCGAIAMIISNNPAIVTIEPSSGYYSEEAMDFWRPNYKNTAIVDGKLSCTMYLKLLKKSWHEYTKLSNIKYQDIDYFCYHCPVPRWVEKAHHKLYEDNSKSEINNFAEAVAPSLIYNQKMGNCYNASLYISILSLLENVTQDLSNKRIGCYSYGSGSVAEYFSAIIQPNYQNCLDAENSKKMLDNRTQLSYDEYKEFYHAHGEYNKNYNTKIPIYTNGHYRLSDIIEHKRIYSMIK